MIRYALRNRISKHYIGFNTVKWEFGTDIHLDYDEENIWFKSDNSLMQKLIKSRKSNDASLVLSDKLLKDFNNGDIEIIEITFPDTDWWDD